MQSSSRLGSACRIVLALTVCAALSGPVFADVLDEQTRAVRAGNAQRIFAL